MELEPEESFTMSDSFILLNAKVETAHEKRSQLASR